VNIIDTIKNDIALANDLLEICDFELFPEMQEVYGSGSATYNIGGMAFGEKKDLRHNEYILLDDNSIAFLGYNFYYPIAGRMAENMTEFFELLVNIPEWLEYLDIGIYKNDILLKEYIDEMEREQVRCIEPGASISSWREKQNSLRERLSIKKYEKPALLKRFYMSATREPKWSYVYYDGPKGFTTIMEDSNIVMKFQRSKGFLTNECCLIKEYWDASP
jgi:hypothetical protein